jgi:4-carboxymuconolactone decarboxylase
MARLPLVPGSADDPRLRPAFDYFRERGREVPALYRALANAPEMLQAWIGLGWPLRAKATSPRGLRELIIMRVAQLTGSTTEWLAHWDMAVAHGVTTAQLGTLANWRASDEFTDAERATLAFTDEMTLDLEVKDETFGTLADHFQPGELVELTLTAAFYSCVARVLDALRIEHQHDADRVAVMRSGQLT